MSSLAKVALGNKTKRFFFGQKFKRNIKSFVLSPSATLEILIA
jgi:hypothetical protein